MSVFKSLPAGAYIREPFEVNASQSFAWVSQSGMPSDGSYSSFLDDGQYIKLFESLPITESFAGDIQDVLSNSGWSIVERQIGAYVSGASVVSETGLPFTDRVLRFTKYQLGSSANAWSAWELSETSASVIRESDVLLLTRRNQTIFGDQWMGCLHRTISRPDADIDPSLPPAASVTLLSTTGFDFHRIENSISVNAFNTGSHGLTMSPDTWYWLRVRTERGGPDDTSSVTKRVKAWEYGTSEPSSWNLEDTRTTALGNRARTFDWDYHPSISDPLIPGGVGFINWDTNNNVGSTTDIAYFAASTDINNPIEAGFLPIITSGQQFQGFSINLAKKPPTNYPTGNDSNLGGLTEGGYYSYPLWESIEHVFYRDNVYDYYPTGSFFVWNIGSRYYGDGIKPTSFKVEISEVSNFIQDDGNQNIRVNGTGSVVGTIFYEHGIVVVAQDEPSNVDSISSSGISIQSNSNVNTTFLSVCDIYEHTINCELSPTDYQWTMNPTVFDTGSDGVSYNTLIQSGSVTPYVTTIGLYNDLNELIAVAKLSKPITRQKWTQQTFVVKFDE